MFGSIIHLTSDKWRGVQVPMKYVSDSYFDVSVSCSGDSARFEFIKRAFDAPYVNSRAACVLYPEHWQGACAWGVVDDGRLSALIQTCPENWSNRLRVTDLWVDERIRRRGVARALMTVAKRQAEIERRRAIILEAQSSNSNAIEFYKSEGFSLIGFDSLAYSNNDIARREVRLELGYTYPRAPRFKDGEIFITRERPDQFKEAEAVTRRAFWNLHRPGCDEHLLVRKLRDDGIYLPGLSRVAVVNGKVVGGIYYSKAVVRGSAGETQVITFGPLSVEPEYQGRGVGGALLNHTLRLAREAGFRAVIIFGEPEYYPRFGFERMDKYGITTPEGKNFDAFMGLELYPGALKGVSGAFFEGDVFRKLERDEVARMNTEFEPLNELYFPSQW